MKTCTILKKGVWLKVPDSHNRGSDKPGAIHRKLILTIFAALAEFERATIRERQKEGIEAAKKRGRHLGRPKAYKPKNWDEVIASWKKGDIRAVHAMKLLNVSKASFYRLSKQ